MGSPATETHLVLAVEDVFAGLEANSDGLVRLRDIAAAMGMTERTLRSKFAASVGMPPMRYLRLLRLTMAQQALRRAAGEGMTVTEVALRYGFLELGRFAVTYRRRFGECPSATLRRSIDDLGGGVPEADGDRREPASSAACPDSVRPATYPASSRSDLPGAER